MPALSTKEIASRINAHLKRFEADTTINAPRLQGGMNIVPYFHAVAYASGRWVTVQYIGYQNPTSLQRDVARRYLAWLDGDHVGRHTDMGRTT